MLFDHRAVMRAQRLAGNAAVAGILRPVLQRSLSHGGFKADAGDQAKLDELTTLVAGYNGLCTTPDALQATGLQNRFKELWSIDKKVHAWFTARQTPNLLAIKNGTEMKALLLETERERDVVVGKLIRAGAPIPMADLGANEGQPQLEALWKGIATGKDEKLKVRGSDLDKTQLLSRLAAIMQTPTGRRCVSFISQHSPQTVELMFSDVAPPTSEGEPGGTSYAAKLEGAGGAEVVAPTAGTELSKRDTSEMAAGLAATARDFIFHDLLPTVAAKTDPTPRQSRIRQALGKPAKAAAVVSRAEPLAADRSRLGTAGGAEVLTPTFITLMHELGHALKIAAGGYLPDDPTLMQHFVDGMTGDQKKYWAQLMGEGNRNMLEELVNILGIENPVRKESGLGEREVYQSATEITKEQTKDKAAAISNLDRDDPIKYMPALSSAFMRLQGTLTDEQVAAINAELDKIDVNALLEAKKAKAAELRRELDELIAGKDGALIAKTMRFRTVRNAADTAAVAPTLSTGELTSLLTGLAALKRDRDVLVNAGKVLAKGKLGTKVDEGGGEPVYTIQTKS
jgi:hypothetical protein